MDVSCWKILSEPRRRSILKLIWDEERSAGDIARQFAITRPAVSQHLRVLREAGLIALRREGTRRLYRAHRPALGDFEDLLERRWRAVKSGLPTKSSPELDLTLD